MSKRCKWGVVVGKPRLENWEGSSEPPNMSMVGKWIIDYLPINGKFLNSHKEARLEAKHQEMNNRFWHFHAKKIESK